MKGMMPALPLLVKGNGWQAKYPEPLAGDKSLPAMCHAMPWVD
jgi:hypothetical protein